MAYKTPKHVEEMKEYKKKQILDSAAKVFSQKGYHNTSVKDIVEEAGISVGSFYFYFKGKEAIFESLFDEMGNQFLAVCNSAVEEALTLEDQVKIGITSFLKCIMDCRHLAKIMLVDAIGVNPAFEQKRVEKLEFFAQFIKGFLDLAMDQGIIPQQDTSITAYAYTGAVNNVITHWLCSGEPESLLDAAPALINFNLRGIGILKEEGGK